MLTSKLGALPSITAVPLAFFAVLKHAKFVLASGPLHLLFPLPISQASAQIKLSHVTPQSRLP